MDNVPNNRQDRQYLRTIFDTVPLPTLVVDEDVRIQDYNKAAGRLLGPQPELILHRRGGDALHCLHSEEKGCGRGVACQHCVIRNSVKEALTGGETHRRMHKAELRSEEKTVMIDLLVTATPLPGGDSPQVLLILEDISELLTLRGLIPICARCKKMRDDQQYWHSIEAYLFTQMSVTLTHGLCPSCCADELKALEAMEVG